MTNIRTHKTKIKKIPPDTPLLQSPSNTSTDIEEVSQVLQHISSPFRWEVLDISLPKSRKNQTSLRK